MEALILVIIGICSIYLYFIFPKIKLDDKKQKQIEELKKYYYAHRGLHDSNIACPENSYTAFKKAVENGYGMELDIQLTKDKKIVVFHDEDLKRMCGISKKISESTYEELKNTKLIDGEETIPLFQDVLDIVGGKTPIIVELKPYDERKALCELTSDILKKYKGLYCVESFHPGVVEWFKKNRVDVIRGQLASNFKSEAKEYGKKYVFKNFLAKNLLLNFMARPHFIAYDRKYPNVISRRICKKLGATGVAWTVRSQKELEEAREAFDIFIFENFIPHSNS